MAAKKAIDIKDLKDLRHGEGNPLGCACGMRGPSPYGNMEMSVILTGAGVRFAFAAPACLECCAAFLTALNEFV